MYFGIAVPLEANQLSNSADCGSASYAVFCAQVRNIKYGIKQVIVTARCLRERGVS